MKVVGIQAGSVRHFIRDLECITRNSDELLAPKSRRWEALGTDHKLELVLAATSIHLQQSG